MGSRMDLRCNPPLAGIADRAYHVRRADHPAQQHPPGDKTMPKGFSAYLSIYNDWDILPDALATIAPWVDEIVLVDGCYDWMVPYYEALGIDPCESAAPVRQAAEACRVPVRIITGIWANEIDKRMAGYAACAGRYIFRIDADELLLIHPHALARFVASGAAVADMEMPIVVAPGLVRARDAAAPLERQCLLFDRQQIDAAAHLRYLWLVLGPEPLPEVSGPLPPVFPEPVAFNSHLTGWRTPDTSIFRAAFYTLNYTRTHGLPWTAWARGGEKVRDITLLLRDVVAAPVYQDLLRISQLVVGEAEPKPRILRAAPPQTTAHPRLGALHDAYLASLAALNRDTAARGRHFVGGDYAVFDLSTPDALAALADAQGAISFIVPDRPHSATARLYRQLDHAPWESEEALAFTLQGERLTIALPPAAPHPPEGATLRRVLRLQMWCAHGGPIHRLLVAAS
jgi:hypothetical protein